MTKLLIVESPAKAKTIEKYLDGEYKVMASVGHIRDLPNQIKKLSISRVALFPITKFHQ